MTQNASNRRGIVVLATFLMVLLLGSDPALAAQTLKDKQAQARKLQDQLERQGDKVSVLAERYNRARLKVGELERSMSAVEAEVARSDERMAQARSLVAGAAVEAYVHGGGNALLSTLTRSGQNDLIVRRQYLRVAVEDQTNTIGELRVAKEDLGENRDRLRSEREEAEDAADQAKKLQREAAEAEASLNATLRKLNGEVAGLVSAEQARREAADAARRKAAAAPKATPKPAPGTAASAAAPTSAAVSVPSSGRGATAVAEARKQLGKPYRYGGSGPDSFDCSGLTSWAWRAAGVSLSHSAHAQWFETTRVPVNQVIPGDLLFFGPSVSGIHHNAIYIGDGQMIEASRTGTPIRIRAWRSGDLVGAGRPG